MKIKTIKLCEETTTMPRGNGDNWHTTWAANGFQYTGLCDGVGFKECPECNDIANNSRIFIMDGPPDDFKFRYMDGYPNLKYDGSAEQLRRSQYFNFGIIALNDTEIYQYLSVPRFIFGWTHNAFSMNKLIYSPDDGASWYNRDMTPVYFESLEERNHDNMMFCEEGDGAFSLISVLQMGQNYSWNTDGYVYICAPNGNSDDTMRQLVMARVPKDKIRDKGAYEFFVARKGPEAKWSPDINKRNVICTFPEGWVNSACAEGFGMHPYSWHPSLMYNKPLGKYMMLNWGMGVGKNKDWFEKPSCIGFWVSDYPWGPWEQIFYQEEWCPRGDRAARAYQPQFMPAWLAEDGKSFYMSWTDFRGDSAVGCTYAYQHQRVDIITEE
jgi:hypothetical protein